MIKDKDRILFVPEKNFRSETPRNLEKPITVCNVCDAMYVTYYLFCYKLLTHSKMHLRKNSLL